MCLCAAIVIIVRVNMANYAYWSASIYTHYTHNSSCARTRYRTMTLAATQTARRRAHSTQSSHSINTVVGEHATWSRRDTGRGAEGNRLESVLNICVLCTKACIFACRVCFWCACACVVCFNAILSLSGLVRDVLNTTPTTRTTQTRTHTHTRMYRARLYY